MPSLTPLGVSIKLYVAASVGQAFQQNRVKEQMRYNTRERANSPSSARNQVHTELGQLGPADQTKTQLE